MWRATLLMLCVTSVATGLAQEQAVGHHADAPATQVSNASVRRDPFVSLLERAEPPSPKRVITSLDDVSLNEITLKGIVRFGGSQVAVVLAPDRKTYLLRLQERLRDATLRALTSDAAIFAQRVLEPLSVVKEREVIKLLRPHGESR